MDMLLLAALAVLVLGFIMLKRAQRGSNSAASQTRRKRPPSSSAARHARSPFAAVSIAFADDACPSVRELEGQRFLEREAPITPLSGCSCTRCQCRYNHHSDRRGAEDRRDPLGSTVPSTEFRGKRDRRSNRERRKDTSEANAMEAGYKELLREAIKEEIQADQPRL